MAPVVSANPLIRDVGSHKRCLLICAMFTLSTFQYGLDYSVVGGFLAMPGFLHVFGYYSPKLKAWNIDPTVQQLVASLIVIGTFIGSMLMGPFSSRFGRRAGLWIAALLNAISCAMMIGTTNVRVLYLARFILGIAVGWFLTFSQMYMQEVAPAHLRGVVFGMYQFLLSLGTVIGSVIDNGTHKIENRKSYQIPLTVFFIAPTIQSILMIWAPESPRWLMVQGRDAEAERALRRLRNPKIEEHQLQAELNEIRESTRQQVEENKKYLFMEMWRGTNLRRTVLSICIAVFHTANGAAWIIAYTTYFLTIAGVHEPFAYSILTVCGGLIGNICSIFFVRYVDRRKVLFYGCLGCGLSQLIPAIVWTVKPASPESGKVIVAFIGIFSFCYTAYSPFTWLLAGELPNNQLRPFTYGLATALTFLGNWAATFSAPYFINPAKLGWSAKYGYIWFVSNLIAATFTVFFVPETRDRTLEEIHEMFEEKVPARKFKGYVCTAVEEFAAQGIALGDAILNEAARNEKNGTPIHVEEVGKRVSDPAPNHVVHA